MPGPLNAGAMIHAVIAEEPSGVIPLPTETVKQSSLVRLLRRERTVLVPGAHHPMLATVPQGRLLAELSVPIIAFLDGGVHDIYCLCSPTFPPRLNMNGGEKPNQSCSPQKTRRRFSILGEGTLRHAIRHAWERKDFIPTIILNGLQLSTLHSSRAPGASSAWGAR